MGAVLEELQQVLWRNLEEHGIVLWFDAEGHYAPGLAAISTAMETAGARWFRYEGSYFALRSAVEPLVRATERPKLLIYVAVAYEEARAPLSELLALGKDVRAGEPGNRNTKLAVIARRALKGRLGEARLAGLEREIAGGQLGLEDLEKLGEESGPQALSAGLSAIFGGTDVDAAAVKFAANAALDAELAARNAVEAWTQALGEGFGLAVHADGEPAGVREELARAVLTADLVVSAGEALPAALGGLRKHDERTTQRLSAIAQAWRRRWDYAASYAVAARAVEEKLQLGRVEVPETVLERVVTFPGLERRLLGTVAERVRQGDVRARAIAAERKEGFWARCDAELQVEWKLVSQAAELVARAGEIAQELRSAVAEDGDGARRIAEAYTQREGGWWGLDAMHRCMEGLAEEWEARVGEPNEAVERLAQHARQQHETVASAMAEEFLRGWEAAGFALPTRYRQSEVFGRFIEPARRSGRTAYVLVDALRFEMGCELAAKLELEFEAELEAVTGTPPTITPVGMAALLPGADALAIGGARTLEVSVAGRKLDSRQGRMKLLADRAGPVVELKIEEGAAALRRRLAGAAAGALVVVTSQEIDQSGEGGLTGARRQMAAVLDQLTLALRRLARAGIEHIVIAADHGFLFGRELAEAEKIDPPGGETLLLHRRAWVGRHGGSSASTMRVGLAVFGLASDLDLITPWNCAGFRADGPSGYFHGGLSPQEVLVPVLSLRARPEARAAAEQALQWTIEPGTGKITSLFVTVRLSAVASGLFAADWPKVRVEVRHENRVYSTMVDATYGLEAGRQEIAMGSESNVVALRLDKALPAQARVRISVMAGDVEIAKLENVEVALGI